MSDKKHDPAILGMADHHRDNSYTERPWNKKKPWQGDISSRPAYKTPASYSGKVTLGNTHDNWAHAYVAEKNITKDEEEHTTCFYCSQPVEMHSHQVLVGTDGIRRVIPINFSSFKSLKKKVTGA